MRSAQPVPDSTPRPARCRLTVYGYWNEGGKGNVVAMLLYICNTFFADSPAPPPAVETTPPTGCLHPAAPGRYFSSPAEYLRWYRDHGALRGTDAPTAAVLLYRKHVITEQPYIAQLVMQMEAEGVVPVPIFINGVEAHTVVRDQLTTQREQNMIRRGQIAWPDGLAKDAAVVRSLPHGSPACITRVLGDRSYSGRRTVTHCAVPRLRLRAVSCRQSRQWIQGRQACR